MKKALIYFAVAGAFAPMLANAEPNVTVYGRLDLSVDHQNIEGKDAITKETDNASRLGFKGVEDLGGNLKAAFGAEFGFNVNNGALTSTVNAFRHTYVGLVGDFGAVALGRLDSANPTGSPLYTQVVKNIPFVVHDAGATAIGTSILRARNRVSNAVGYESPEFGGFVVRARYYLQGPDTPTGTGLGVIQLDDFKSIDVGVDYAKGPFSAAIGFGQDRKRGGYIANDFKNKWQAMASYDLSMAKVYGFYGRDNHAATASTRDTVNYWLLGTKVPFGGQQDIVANYMQKDVQGDQSGKEKRFQVGYTYSMSKRTKLYATYDNDDPNSNKSNDKLRVLSVGVQHNF